MSFPTRPLLLAAILATGVPCACTTVSVSSDYDPEFDFAQYRTFSWLEEKQPLTGDVRLDNPLLHERVRASIETALSEAGYALAEMPDFRVGYHLSLERKYDVTTLERHYGYGPGWRAGPMDTVVTEYEQGTLVIDVVDRVSDRLVWRGGAQGRVRESGTPDERAQRVQEVVSRILGEFPPRAEP